MAFSRRDAIALGIGAPVGLAWTGRTEATLPDPCPTAPTWRAGIEGQRRADRGDGTFLNPVLSGDRPDPNILKDGEDYWATFSSFDYYPGVVVWHSRDLVNWAPVGPALTRPIGSIWALDIAKHDGRYFIYMPVFHPTDPSFKAGPRIPCKTFVVHAASMRGPWSEPIDLDIKGFIDPGHAVGEDGKRYLFFNEVARVRLSDDGLRRDGEIEHVYDGWPIPEDWVIEAIALEGPKVLRRNGWFYLFSGQGGTAGPPTSHMVIVARSRSIHGPWENCPHNPIVRTATAREPWWSRGHGTAVEGPDGRWWLAYHGYENGARTLGRQMLLEPMEWDAEGWPRMKGGDLSGPLPMPARGSPGAHGLALSGPFRASDLGTRMAFFAPAADYRARASFRDGAMTLRGQGDGPAASSPLAFVAGDRSYEIEVDVELAGGAEAGLVLFYNTSVSAGLGATADLLQAYKGGKAQGYPPPGPAAGRRFSVKVVNDEDVASFFVRAPGASWRKAISFEVSGYNHNVADGFLSLRPALFAAGEGAATFANFTYRVRP